MSEDAEFNIEQWRKEFDAEIEACKRNYRKADRLYLTVEDCKFLIQCGIRVD